MDILCQTKTNLITIEWGSVQMEKELQTSKYETRRRQFFKFYSHVWFVYTHVPTHIFLYKLSFFFIFILFSFSSREMFSPVWIYIRRACTLPEFPISCALRMFKKKHVHCMRNVRDHVTPTKSSPNTGTLSKRARVRQNKKLYGTGTVFSSTRYNELDCQYVIVY